MPMSEQEMRVAVLIELGWTNGPGFIHEGIENWKDWLGWHPVEHPFPAETHSAEMPNPLVDLNAAITLCGVMAKEGFCCTMHNEFGPWQVQFEDVENFYMARNNQLPAAIVEAFLKAKGRTR